MSATPKQDAAYALAIKDVVGMETQIADALVDSFEDTPEIQVGAYAIAEVVLALIESRFSAPSPSPEGEGDDRKKESIHHEALSPQEARAVLKWASSNTSTSSEAKAADTGRAKLRAIAAGEET